jgi:hypothetical protein
VTNTKNAAAPRKAFPLGPPLSNVLISSSTPPDDDTIIGSRRSESRTFPRRDAECGLYGPARDRRGGGGGGALARKTLYEPPAHPSPRRTSRKASEGPARKWVDPGQRVRRPRRQVARRKWGQSLRDWPDNEPRVGRERGDDGPSGGRAVVRVREGGREGGRGKGRVDIEGPISVALAPEPHRGCP